MPHVLIGGLLILHGLKASFVGVGPVSNPNAAAMAVPAWMAW